PTARAYGPDQAGAFLERDGCRYLGEDVLALLESGHALRYVQMHRRRDDHGIEIRFEHAGEVVIAVGDLVPIRNRLEGVRIRIAQGGDVGVRDRTEPGDESRAALPNDADSQAIPTTGHDASLAATDHRGHWY